MVNNINRKTIDDKSADIKNMIENTGILKTWPFSSQNTHDF